MGQRPVPGWYTLNVDASAPTGLLDDDGHPKPHLSADAEHAPVALAAAMHATTWRHGERERRHVESFIAMQRWRSKKDGAASELESLQRAGQNRPAPAWHTPRRRYIAADPSAR